MTILNVIQGVMKACGTGVELAVNPDMFQAMAIEARFVIAGVIQGEGCMSKITGPMGLAPFYSLQLLIREGRGRGSRHVWCEDREGIQ